MSSIFCRIEADSMTQLDVSHDVEGTAGGEGLGVGHGVDVDVGTGGIPFTGFERRYWMPANSPTKMEARTMKMRERDKRRRERGVSRSATS